MIFKEWLLILLPFFLYVVPDYTKEDESYGDINGHHDGFDTDAYVLYRDILERVFLVNI